MAQHLFYHYTTPPAMDPNKPPPQSPFAVTPGCYAPRPMITVLMDPQPDDLRCVICKESRVVFGCAELYRDEEMSMDIGQEEFMNGRHQGPAEGESEDKIPVLFPCSRIAGYLSMQKWLNDRDCYPVCRLDLRYAGCMEQHAGERDAMYLYPNGQVEVTIPRAEPRILDVTRTHYMPLTIFEGGKLLGLCSSCDLEPTEQRWRQIVRREGEMNVEEIARVRGEVSKAREWDGLVDGAGGVNEHFWKELERLLVKELDELLSKQRSLFTEKPAMLRRSWKRSNWYDGGPRER